MSWTDAAREASIEARRSNALGVDAPHVSPTGGLVKVMGGIVESKPDTGLTEETSKWLNQWSFGKSGTFDPRALPSADVLDELKTSRPDKPIMVYRSHIEGTDSSPGLESWSRSKAAMETMSDPANREGLSDQRPRVVLSRRVDPSEIVVSGSHLPDAAKDQDFLEHEVLVANGDVAKQVATSRDETLTKGQQWSGKWSSMAPYARRIS